MTLTIVSHYLLKSAIVLLIVAPMTQPTATKLRNGERFDTGVIFASRIGRGTKLHPVILTIWRQADDSYRPNLNAPTLNRQGIIVAWLDSVSAATKSARPDGY